MAHNTQQKDKKQRKKAIISKVICSLKREAETELKNRTANHFTIPVVGGIFYHGTVKIVANYQSEAKVLSVLLYTRRGLVLVIPLLTNEEGNADNLGNFFNLSMF